MAYIIIGLLAFAGLAAVGYMAFQLYKEIKPTMEAAKSAGAIFQQTVQSAQPIAENFQSISDHLNQQVNEAKQTAGYAVEVKDKVLHTLQVLRPVTQAWSIYRASHNSFIPAKKHQTRVAKELNLVIDRSKKTWSKLSSSLKKKFSKKRDTRKAVLMISIPLAAGVAAGGYAAYRLRERRHQSEQNRTTFSAQRWQPEIRRLPRPSVPNSPDSETEEDSQHQNGVMMHRPWQLRARAFFRLTRESYDEWNKDHASELGAALAYYTVFSLSPLLIIVVAIAGFLFGREAAQGEIVRQIGGIIGYQSAEVIQKMIQSAREPATGIIATIAGFVTLLFGATGVFGELQSALDRIWEIPPKPNQGVLGLLKERFVSFTMVLGIGFLFLVSLVLSAGLTAFSNFVGNSFQGSLLMLQIINALVSFAVITLLFAMIYKILPDVQLEWRDVWLGALITSIFFGVGKFFIGLYLGKSSVTSTFGAAGSLVLILVWVYYSAQIFLYGAEFTQVYAKRRGSWRLARSPQEKIKPERKVS